MLEFTAIEQFLNTADGWRDMNTILMAIWLFGVLQLIGGLFIQNTVESIDDERVIHAITVGRHALVSTLGRCKPSYQLRKWLPSRVLPLRTGNPGIWPWKEVLHFMIVGGALAYIDTLLLWGGLPWIIQQAGLPIWIAVIGAGWVWVGGHEHRIHSTNVVTALFTVGLGLAASPIAVRDFLLVAYGVGIAGAPVWKVTATGSRWVKQYWHSSWV